MFEPEVFRKQIYCCTKVLVTLFGLFGDPQSFGALIVIRRLGNCAPCPPSLRPWLLRAATPLNKSWYTALTRGISEPRVLGGAKFSIRPNFCAPEEKRIGEYCRAIVLFQKLAQKYREVFPEVFKSCPNLPPPLRTPIVLTQKLWQNTSYLQFGGLNKWIYAVIASFAQHLDICNPKLGKWRSLPPPPGYASGNSDWWLCGFDPFIATANP